MCLPALGHSLSSDLGGRYPGVVKPKEQVGKPGQAEITSVSTISSQSAPSN